MLNAEVQNNTATFQPAEEVLSPYLKTYKKKKKKKKPYWSIAIISIVFIALATWGYFDYTAGKKWSEYIERLNSVPGIIVTESGKNNGKYFIFGLKDRLSEEPIKIMDEFDLDSSKVVSTWDTYSSLSPNVIQIRIDKVLDPPATVVCKIIDDTLVVTGSAHHKWINMLGLSFHKVMDPKFVTLQNLVNSIDYQPD
jgi:OOP family OmpA-OmpF porin